jgi:hypothetical protein
VHMDQTSECSLLCGEVVHENAFAIKHQIKCTKSKCNNKMTHRGFLLLFVHINENPTFTVLSFSKNEIKPL